MTVTLYHGDCLVEMDKIEAGSVDLVLTDPPYGTTACKWDSIIDLELMWRHLKRIVKNNGATVMTSSQPFTTTLISSNINDFKYCWAWQKNKATNFLNAQIQPLRSYEDVCVFYSGQCVYNPQKTHGHRPVNSFTKNTSDGDTLGQTKIGFSGGGQTDRHPTNMIQGISFVINDSSRGQRLHPSQKPVALMEYLIKTYTTEGDTVLDFTMGSGSTGVACMNTGRKFIGIERDDKYFEIAKDRIADARHDLLNFS